MNYDAHRRHEYRTATAARGKKMYMFFAGIQVFLAIVMLVAYFFFDGLTQELVLIAIVVSLFQPSAFFYYAYLEGTLTINQEATDQRISKLNHINKSQIRQIHSDIDKIKDLT